MVTVVIRAPTLNTPGHVVVPGEFYEREKTVSLEVVEADKVILIHYTLTDDEGTVLDSSRDEEGEPLPYLHGHQNIVPGLEAGLDGKKVGDKLVVDVAPEDGYGVRHDEPPQPVPREAFPEGVELEPEMSFFVEAPNGQPVQVFVASVEDDVVFLDTNHPLAGKTLHFDVEIVGVREPHPSELEHGHPHGIEGGEHHHH